MRLVLLVEGQTEKRVVPPFVRRWLDPRTTKRIRVVADQIVGSARLIRDAERRVKLLLSERDVLAVFGLIDLYGASPSAGGGSVADRVRRLKAGIENPVRKTGVGPERFRQFVAVHELEAWLLSQPEVFPSPVRMGLEGIRRPPEDVDFSEPPKRLLKRLYEHRLKRDYRPMTDGTHLFAKLDPDTAYQRCPNLREMLDAVLAVAQGVA